MSKIYCGICDLLVQAWQDIFSYLPEALALNDSCVVMESHAYPHCHYLYGFSK